MICVYWNCVCWNERLAIWLIMHLCSIMYALMSEFYSKLWSNLCLFEKCYTNKVAGLEFDTCLCLRYQAFLVPQMTVWPPQTTKTALPWTPGSYSGEENKSKIETIQKHVNATAQRIKSGWVQNSFIQLHCLICPAGVSVKLRYHKLVLYPVYIWLISW